MNQAVERVGGLEWEMGGELVRAVGGSSGSVSGSMSVAARAWRSLERGMEVAGSGVGGEWVRSAAEEQKSVIRVAADWGVRRELVRVSCRETTAWAAGRSVWSRLE